MRWLCVLLVACSRTPPPAASPVAQAPPTTHEGPIAAPRTALDDLAFLDGCCNHFYVDWGFEMCWQREPTAWVGHIETNGGKRHESLETAIVLVGGQLFFTIRGNRLGDWLVKHDAVPVFRLIPNTNVSFGFSANAIDFDLTAMADLGVLVRPWMNGPRYSCVRGN